MQLDLFGKNIEKPKPCCYNNNPDVENWEQKIAEQGRKHIGYPCDIAQDMPIDDRPEHCATCPECKELIKKYDTICYGTRNR